MITIPNTLKLNFRGCLSVIACFQLIYILRLCVIANGGNAKNVNKNNMHDFDF